MNREEEMTTQCEKVVEQRGWIPFDSQRRCWILQSACDTSASRKQKQLARMPEVLITTPESFALMLSREQSRREM
ncbi:MAG: hypothetical protein ACLFM0_10480 [Spirochaetales bacterium]